MDFLIALAIGLTAGVLSGMLGIGGGAVAVPGIVLLLGEEQHTAQGVSLGAMFLVATLGALIHSRQENVEVNMVMRIAPCAAAFAILGAWTTNMITPEWLTRVFAVVLLGIGCHMLLFSRGGQGVSTS